MTLDALWAWMTRMHDTCVCNQAITDEPYFGMLMGEDQDEDAIVFFDPTHDQCLAEWGLSRYPDDPLGVRHCSSTASDDTITERLARYTGGA